MTPKIQITGIGSRIGYREMSEGEVCLQATKTPGYLCDKTGLTKVLLAREDQVSFINDFCMPAIYTCLIDAGMTTDDIDGIFVSHSSSGGTILPTLSSMLIAKLGIATKKRLIAKDINSACSGFGDALDTAYKEMRFRKKGQEPKNYLILSGDMLGTTRKQTDIKTGMLSDGVGCILITNNPNLSSKHNLTLAHTASGVSSRLSQENILGIEQKNSEYLTMNSGRALQELLGNTADEIFDLLDIDTLENNTIVIPHQPNANMIDAWSAKSTYIQQALSAGKSITIHDETYREQGNFSGASVVVGLESVIKSLDTKKRTIILAPFGAGGHIAGAHICYGGKKLEKTKNHEFVEHINELLLGKNSLPSYRKRLHGAGVVDTTNAINRHIPDACTLEGALSSIDVLGMIYLLAGNTNKEYITKSISYKVHENTGTFNGLYRVDKVYKEGFTKNGNPITTMHIISNGLTITSEFVEIDPVPHIQHNPRAYIYMQHEVNTYYDETDNDNQHQVTYEQLNLHGNLGGYESLSLLIEYQKQHYGYTDMNGKIYFISPAKGGDTITIYPTNTQDVSLPKWISQQEGLVLYNHTNDKPVALYTKTGGSTPITV